MMLRAKVTYTGDDDPATTEVNEDGWPIWVEYTEVLTVSGADVTNDAPEVTGEPAEIRVELGARPAAPAMGDQDPQPAKVVTFDASSLFFDPDGDDLTYTITAGTDLDVAAETDTPGVDADLGTGGGVYRVFATEEAADPTDPDVRTDLQQSFSIDQDTGMITYFTDKEQDHDGTTIRVMEKATR